MERDRFDELTRVLAASPTRRGVAGMLGLAALAGLGQAEAKKKKRKKRKRRRGNAQNPPNTPTPPPVVEPNRFGCVDVGNFCERSDQCCSGICTSGRCRDHDVANCQAGQNDLFCSAAATNVDCTTPNGGDGLCLTTTGNAGFCVGDRKCFACTKDSDCQPGNVCGQDAACIVCANCVDTGGTACAATVAEGCF